MAESYRQMLRDYVAAANLPGDHTPYVLEQALSWHVRYGAASTMLPEQTDSRAGRWRAARSPQRFALRVDRFLLIPDPGNSGHAGGACWPGRRLPRAWRSSSSSSLAVQLEHADHSAELADL